VCYEGRHSNTVLKRPLLACIIGHSLLTTCVIVLYIAYIKVVDFEGCTETKTYQTICNNCIQNASEQKQDKILSNEGQKIRMTSNEAHMLANKVQKIRVTSNEAQQNRMLANKVQNIRITRTKLNQTECYRTKFKRLESHRMKLNRTECYQTKFKSIE